MSTQIATIKFAKLEPYLNPQGARTLALQFAASQTIAKGTVVGLITASGKAKVYASGSSDGSQIPIGFTVYDIVVDASGNITYGPSGAVPDLLHGFDQTSPVYWKGTFLEADLTGLDANAVTVMLGREMGIGAAGKCVTIG